MATPTRKRLVDDHEIASDVTVGPVTRLTDDASAHGTLYWLDTSGDVPLLRGLPIPSDWATREYALGIAFGRPIWRATTGSGGVLDPATLTADTTIHTADTTDHTADQTEDV